jgi:hypothetical protein
MGRVTVLCMIWVCVTIPQPTRPAPAQLLDRAHLSHVDSGEHSLVMDCGHVFFGRNRTHL